MCSPSALFFFWLFSYIKCHNRKRNDDCLPIRFTLPGERTRSVGRTPLLNLAANSCWIRSSRALTRREIVEKEIRERNGKSWRRTNCMRSNITVAAAAWCCEKCLPNLFAFWTNFFFILFPWYCWWWERLVSDRWCKEKRWIDIQDIADPWIFPILETCQETRQLWEWQWVVVVLEKCAKYSYLEQH